MPQPTLQTYCQTKIKDELKACTQCGACLKACPVYDNTFTITQLNTATQQGTKQKPIKDFAWQCISCKRCISVCPEKLNRLDMMIQLRSKIKTPYRFKRYILIRGTTKHVARIIQKLYTTLQQYSHPKQAAYMQGTLIQKNKTKVLFYPGCYTHSPTTLQHSLNLLNTYNVEFSVLGGMSTCCGLPHLLQGQYTKAEVNLKALHHTITKSGCTTVISGCLECVEAIQLAAHLYKGAYTSQSINDYLKTTLHIKSTGKKLGNTLLLAGCRTTNTAQLEIQLKQLSTHLTTKKGCCAHWNLKYQHTNQKLIEELQEHIKTHNIHTVVCECLTCYEEIKDSLKTPTKELIQLLEENQ